MSLARSHVLVFGGLLLAAPAAQGRPKKPYAMVQTGLAATPRSARQIDGDGRVLGTSQKGRPAIWKGSGKPVALDLPGEVQPLGFDGKGGVFGLFKVGGVDHGFLLEDGKLRDLHETAGFRPMSANGKGQLVGFAPQSSDGNLHCALLSGAELQDLGALGKGQRLTEACIATDVNEKGQVVGYTDHQADGQHRAFLWAEGKKLELGTMGGAWSEALAINARGEVVGNSVDASGQPRAFLWSKGRLRPLKGLVEAYGIDDAGRVVGVGLRKWEERRFAAIYERGAVRELGKLIPKTTLELTAARAINGKGEIVVSVAEGEGEAATRRIALLRPSDDEAEPGGKVKDKAPSERVARASARAAGKVAKRRR